jgi:hypothetical protein
MADRVNTQALEMFFQELGKRYEEPAMLYLVGGSALVLLGSDRPTLDIDYVGIDIPGLWDELQRLIDEIATEMDLKIEAVPYREMIPLSSDTEERHIYVGRYGTIDVYVFDPYAMALGKLDRGFPSDLEDIVFMLEHNLLNLPQFEKVVQDALPVADQYDMNPAQMQKNLNAVRILLKR